MRVLTISVSMVAVFIYGIARFFTQQSLKKRKGSTTPSPAELRLIEKYMHEARPLEDGVDETALRKLVKSKSFKKFVHRLELENEVSAPEVLSLWTSALWCVWLRISFLFILDRIAPAVVYSLRCLHIGHRWSSCTNSWRKRWSSTARSRARFRTRKARNCRIPSCTTFPRVYRGS